jgi:hypothetical protein
MLQHDIILYHFTSDLHVNGCLTEGITKGVTYTGQTCTGIGFLRGTQWLTCNSDFNQAWGINGTLPYDRTAHRLTVCIPQQFIENLVPWVTHGRLLAPKTFNELSTCGDPENWFIYLGAIPPEWIVERVKKSMECGRIK